MMNAITTREAPIVQRLIRKYGHDGMGGLNWGKYRYHIADIWDGDAWVTVVVRTPRASIDSGRFAAPDSPFGAYHYMGAQVYAYL